MTHSPTPQQQAIFDSAIADRNVLVIARAGCGKTSTLVMLAERLEAAGLLKAQPNIALAFNVKIKKEMAERLPKSIEALTLNGLGHRAWASGRGRLQLDSNKTFNMVDDYMKAKSLSITFDEKRIIAKLVDQAKLIGLVPQNCPYPGKGLSPDTQQVWNSIWAFIDEEPNDETQVIAREVLNASIARGFGKYIDFNDQIYLPTLFGGAFPQPNLLMVDEFQDLSMINHLMIRKCRAKQVIMVGDPMQAIYAFRGAMTDSMDRAEECVTNGKPLETLYLTKTFRCGKKIVQRAQELVPDFVAADHNPEGEILYWPEQNIQDHNPENQSWTPHDVPNGAAILCRNNAPLITCALRFLRAKRGVQILGREFAERLTKDLKKACPESSTPISEALVRVEAYYNAKLSKKPTQSQMDLIFDRLSAFRALAEADDVEDLASLLKVLDEIFSNEHAQVTLATGHKAKGLEWDWVMHLNPHLIPARFADTPEAIQQEHNLRYVIETRPKKTLVLARLEDLEV